MLTHWSLVSCLSNLDIRTPGKQMSLWAVQKRLHQRTNDLVRLLGKPSVTAPQAKRLDTLGYTYTDLVTLRKEFKDGEHFKEILKTRGVNSKPLREKLLKLLS